MSSRWDRHGNVDMLRFPAFHDEVLLKRIGSPLKQMAAFESSLRKESVVITMFLAWAREEDTLITATQAPPAPSFHWALEFSLDRSSPLPLEPPDTSFLTSIPQVEGEENEDVDQSRIRSQAGSARPCHPAGSLSSRCSTNASKATSPNPCFKR